jgi:hypothetical protein
MVFFYWGNSEGWPVRFVSPNVLNPFGYNAEEFISRHVNYAELRYRKMWY